MVVVVLWFGGVLTGFPHNTSLIYDKKILNIKAGPTLWGWVFEGG